MIKEKKEELSKKMIIVKAQLDEYKDIEEGINEVDDAALALLKKYNYV